MVAALGCRRGTTVYSSARRTLGTSGSSASSPLSQPMTLPFTWQLAGFPIQIHQSWVLASALMMWGLSTQYFPQDYPGAATWTLWTAGTTATILIFFSLLFHELAHALVTRWCGGSVNNITLHLLGGWTSLDQELTHPRHEIRVALAGPACSLVLATAFWGADTNPVAAYLARINVLVGGLNLLPLIPLDGGRCMRALIWTHVSSYAHATMMTARWSQAVSMVLILYGTTGFLTDRHTGWYLIGGLIVFVLASHTKRQVQDSHLLHGTVESWMIPSTHVITTTPSNTMRELHHLYVQYGFHWLLVCKGTDIVGLVNAYPDSDFQSHPPESTIEQKMEPVSSLLTVEPNLPLTKAFDQCVMLNAPCLFVWEGAKWRGILTRSTLNRLRFQATRPVTPTWKDWLRTRRWHRRIYGSNLRKLD